MTFAKPYLLFLGASTAFSDVKTATGLRDWCRDDVAGQWALEECGLDLGIAHLTPESAVAAGARSLVIGVAPVGGAIPASWAPALVRALTAGLDLVSGMHTRLSAVSGISVAANALGRKLYDLRHTDRIFEAATGVKRSGRRLLTVGMDCALGKKYAALAITKAMVAGGAAATFRATGQTGIMIAGAGIAIDAVVADFIAGAAESLSPAAGARHWDVIEGQGALFHPEYAGVTLGLIHGSQPDALVLCHDPCRTHLEGFPGFPLPTLQTAMDRYLEAARLTNRECRFVGISLNTSAMAEAHRIEVMAALTGQFGLPVIDPMRDGARRIAQRIERDFPVAASR